METALTVLIWVVSIAVGLGIISSLAYLVFFNKIRKSIFEQQEDMWKNFRA